MHRNKSVSTHQFAMVPRAEIPRSGFNIESGYKTTFDAGLLIPVYCEEVLPGDSFNLKATFFARLATPIVPIMDNLYLDSFYFFVPNRLVWDNWVRFMGDRDDPDDNIDFTIPQLSGLNAVPSGTIFDYFGLPIGVPSLSANALPFRAYNLIWNRWFRDQNLQDRVNETRGDTDFPANYTLLRRGKRHDYFTSCLPWVQKGDSVQLPLGTEAPVKTSNNVYQSGAGNAMLFRDASTGNPISNSGDLGVGTSSQLQYNASGIGTPVGNLYPSNMYADLSAATSATINQIRQAFQIQRLLERDARGGTRYTEILRSHFGVISPDARLQRPEYLGGGTVPINITPIAQTQQTDPAGTPLGNLAAVGTALSRNGFTQSFTEHGYVIGLISVRADLSYQQGLHKMWSRETRYDFYWPVFANLGEQAVLNREIMATGGTSDDAVFGYQERWAEYRYKPSLITGQLRSTFAQPLDIWHLAQEFATVPTLNATFIEDNPPVERIIATTDQTGQQFVLDALFQNRVARPLPMYSVPGLVDHF